MEIRNNLPANYPLKSTELLNLFRIIQEAFQNTLKYAGANSISISFHKTDDGFRWKSTMTESEWTFQRVLPPQEMASETCVTVANKWVENLIWTLKQVQELRFAAN